MAELRLIPGYGAMVSLEDYEAAERKVDEYRQALQRLVEFDVGREGLEAEKEYREARKQARDALRVEHRHEWVRREEADDRRPLCLTCRVIRDPRDDSHWVAEPEREGAPIDGDCGLTIEQQAEEAKSQAEYTKRREGL